MCGIFGWQFRPNFKPNLATRSVLAATLGKENLARGKDSWGYYAADTNEICHGLGSIVGHTHAMAYSHSLIGHTRHGTTGAVTIPNAHPYEINGFVGAHNGTIGNHRELNEMRKSCGEPEYEVDSMHLIDSISRGLDACMEVVGYGAVEWVDLNHPGTIRLCRMTTSGDLRLFMGKEGIVWSSSKPALESAIEAAGLRGFIFEEPKEGLVIDIHNGVIHASADKIMIGELTKNYSYSHGGSMGFQQQGGTGTQSSQSTAYGSRGTALIEAYRARQIAEGESKREERKKKKALGKAVDPAVIEGKNPIKNESTLSLCALCYEEVGDSGRCGNGHDCSAQTTLVLDV